MKGPDTYNVVGVLYSRLSVLNRDPMTLSEAQKFRDQLADDMLEVPNLRRSAKTVHVERVSQEVTC